MKRAILFFTFLLGTVALTMADSRPELAVSKINKKLFTNANAIIREASKTIEVINPDKMEVTETFVVTILNDKAEKALLYNVAYYDSNSKVNDMEAYLYDKWGTEIDKARNKDISDEAIDDGFSVAVDTRVRYVSFDHNAYPYTLEFKSVVTEYNSFSWPTWRPLTFDNVAVEKSSFAISFPEEMNVTYKEYLEALGEYDFDESPGQLSWSIQNKTAYVDEPLGPSLRNQLPRVAVNLGKISYDGNDGDLSTWAGFGAFYYSLNKNRDQVPESLKQEVLALTAGASSKTEKIKILYNYLQNNTRYVSVQLGIGGLQCFPAEYVAEKGFGDCKALSNYMKALLKLVDIPSNYVLIQADRKPMTLDKSFPQDPFNHVILGVPMEKDTVWLECTSQQIPMGYIGVNNMNRQVLWIEADGKSKLVRTPGYVPEDHALVTTAQFDVQEDGGATVAANIQGTGFQQRRFRGLKGLSSEELKRFFEGYIPISTTFALNDYSVTVEEDRPETSLSYKVDAKKVAKVSSSRMFLSPGLLEPALHSPKRLEDRKHPLVLQVGFHDVSEYTFTLPAGYEVEAMPKDQNIATPYGAYETSYSFDNNKLVFKRKYTRNSGEWESEKYNDYVDFVKQVVRADKDKIVLKKAE
ncbi:MAG: DUF3857 and transglutaminase domain-containing protein [Saprospiraceae bacterium]|nr:DUF3857 and transglutaminase domain-containing protein [Saprospiraceae bacterium]